MRDGTRAVDRVSLTLEPGRWTGIIGANGSGKTSLLRAVAGRLDAQGGAIVVDGFDRTADRGWRARQIGFAPDLASLPEALTGVELFAIVAPGWDDASRGGCAGTLRQALEINRFAAGRIGTLSAGMKQRLAIFLAFLNRPRAVVLDEPFTWLDPVCAYDTKEALADLLAGEGLALATALHEMPTLVACCHSGLLMSDGRASFRLDAEHLADGRRDFAAFEAAMIDRLRGASLPQG